MDLTPKEHFNAIYESYANWNYYKHHVARDLLKEKVDTFEKLALLNLIYIKNLAQLKYFNKGYFNEPFNGGFFSEDRYTITLFIDAEFNDEATLSEFTAAHPNVAIKINVTFA